MKFFIVLLGLIANFYKTNGFYGIFIEIINYDIFAMLLMFLKQN